MDKHRDDEGNGQDGRRERKESSNVQRDGEKQKGTDGIDYDQLLIDSAQFLQIYDTDIIYSWTPREFKNFLKGSQLRTIDECEMNAMSAMFVAKVKNSKKRIKLKDIYDSDKARKDLDGPKKKEALYLDRYLKAMEAMKKRRTT